MQTYFKDRLVTRQMVLDILQDFDLRYPDPNRYDNWLVRQSYKYVLWHNGRQYPPKHVLSTCTGISTTEFSGGEQTNRVFRALGFVVTDK